MGWSSLPRIGSPSRSHSSNGTAYYTTYFGITCSAQNGDVTGLDLWRCNLQGTLIASLGALTELEDVRLSINQLTGTLPRQWSAMTRIRALDLHMNQLTGTLPDEWSAMTRMDDFHLEMNHFQGTVPTKWPVGMRSIKRDYSCNISCSGVVGVNADCTVVRVT